MQAEISQVQISFHAEMLLIDLFACLGRHDVTPAFKNLGDVIETGVTGTNVNDLKIMVLFADSGG